MFWYRYHIWLPDFPADYTTVKQYSLVWDLPQSVSGQWRNISTFLMAVLASPVSLFTLLGVNSMAIDVLSPDKFSWWTPNLESELNSYLTMVSAVAICTMQKHIKEWLAFLLRDHGVESRFSMYKMHSFIRLIVFKYFILLINSFSFQLGEPNYLQLVLLL